MDPWAGQINRRRSYDAVLGSKMLKCRDPEETPANNWGQITEAVRASSQQKIDGKTAR